MTKQTKLITYKYYHFTNINTEIVHKGPDIPTYIHALYHAHVVNMHEQLPSICKQIQTLKWRQKRSLQSTFVQCIWMYIHIYSKVNNYLNIKATGCMCQNMAVHTIWDGHGYYMWDGHGNYMRWPCVLFTMASNTIDMINIPFPTHIA